MRKINLMISVLGLLILACSSTDLISTAPPTPSPAPLPTEALSAASTPTEVLVPTLPPPTFTSMPTATDTASPPTATLVATSTSPIQLTPQGPVFDSVTVSGNQINWGENCPANSVTVTAHTASGFNVTSVLLFTRLQGQTRDVTTRWSSGVSMHTAGGGTFTYDLSAKGIQYSQDFKLAWVQYQLVATNSQRQVVERTQPDLNSITLAHCP